MMDRGFTVVWYMEACMVYWYIYW